MYDAVPTVQNSQTFYSWLPSKFSDDITGVCQFYHHDEQGNQEPLVVRQGRKTPGELGVNKSMECDSFSCRASTLLVGLQEGHLACKN